jgi:hypothetical protein
LTQLGSRFGQDSLDGHTATVIVGCMISKGIITEKMSTLSGFMAALKFWSEISLSSGLRLSWGTSRCSSEYATYFPAELSVSVGDSQAYNVLWRVSQSALEQLKCQARSTLFVLQGKSTTNDVSTNCTDGFRQVFLSRYSFASDFDVLVHIPVVSAHDLQHADPDKNATDLTEDELEKLKSECLNSLLDKTAWQFCSTTARGLLIRALGDRAQAAHTLSDTYHDQGNQDKRCGLLISSFVSLIHL